MAPPCGRASGYSDQANIALRCALSVGTKKSGLGCTADAPQTPTGRNLAEFPGPVKSTPEYLN